MAPRKLGLRALLSVFAIATLAYNAMGEELIECHEEWLADGWCDDSNNNEQCNWDGGDCCRETCIYGRVHECGSNDYDCKDPALQPGHIDCTQENFSPTACAGQCGRDSRLKAVVGESIELDGAHSSDPERQPLTYTWRSTSTPLTSWYFRHKFSAAISNPTFVPDVIGVYHLALTVDDGCSESQDVLVLEVVSANEDSDPKVRCGEFNKAPKANAGPDMHVHASLYKRIYVDGTGTEDEDPSSLSFEWSFQRIPWNSALTDDMLDNRMTPVPNFVPDCVDEQECLYTLRLEVSDGCLSTTDEVTIHVVDRHQDLGQRYICYENDPTPGASLATGESVDLVIGELAYLDGTGSWDDKHDVSILHYRWSFSHLPRQSSLHFGDLVGGRSGIVSFIPDVIGSYEVSLVVDDGCSASEYIVLVHVSKEGEKKTHCEEVTSVPYANAGPTQKMAGQLKHNDVVVYLDGGASKMWDGQRGTVPPTFAWAFESVPQSSRLTTHDIIGADSPQPLFRPDTYGWYRIRLTVGDECQSSDDVVAILVVAAEEDKCDGFNVAPLASAYSVLLDGAVLIPLDLTDSTPFTTLSLANLTVLLDGTESTDFDSEDLTYKWEFTHLPDTSSLRSECAGSNRDSCIVDTDERVSRFSPDVYGWYQISLTVGDGCSTAVDQVDLYFKYGRGDRDVDDNGCDPVLPPPSVDAGPDQHISLPAHRFGEDIAFSYGTARSAYPADDEEHAVKYHWSFASVPTLSRMTNRTLHNPDSVVTSFYPDVVGDYVLVLTASDGCKSATDTLIVHLTEEAESCLQTNMPPHIFPGLNNTVNVFGLEGVSLTLNASMSYDPDTTQDSLAAQWSVYNIPIGSNLTTTSLLSFGNGLVATFHPDVAGTFVFRLEVSDGCSHMIGYRAINVVSDCTPENQPPSVNIGQNQTVTLESQTPAVLSSAGTFDDYGMLNMTWRLVSRPNESNATLEGALTPLALLLPDVAGDYRVCLDVSDGCHTSTKCIVVSAIEKVDTCADSGPIANSGANQTFALGKEAIAILDASLSIDRAGEGLACQWVLNNKPEFSNTDWEDFEDAESCEDAAFYPDVVGVYEIELRITDSVDCSDEATLYVTVTSANVEPEPEPEPDACEGLRPIVVTHDQSIAFAKDLSTVLNITGSDGGSCSWSVATAPEFAGEWTDLLDFVDSCDSAELWPTVAGEYVLQVVVTDIVSGCSSAANVTVEIVQESMLLTLSPETEQVQREAPHAKISGVHRWSSPSLVALLGFVVVGSAVLVLTLRLKKQRDQIQESGSIIPL